MKWSDNITVGVEKSAGWAMAVAFLAGHACVSPSQAQPALAEAVPRAMASNGALVPMPDISTLDCQSMAEALRRIDLTKYRDQEALTSEHPDWRIFEYEDRLARSYYADCVLREHGFGDPAAAFSFGFETAQ